MQYNGMNLCDFCFTPIGSDGVCRNCGLTHQTYTIQPGLLMPGTILYDKYIIGKVLGRGGFGATYLAFNPQWNKVVAIKEYFPLGISYRKSDSHDVAVISENKREVYEQGAERFYREAQTISKFSNNNIVSIYEFFKTNDTAYYAMEYLDGVDLKSYIANSGGRLPEQEVIRITKAVCRALMVVHCSMVLHRDIAPDNIFMCRNGDVKLIDFGTAKQVMFDAGGDHTVVLKQGFAPHESYAKSGRQGAWTDIYALGATMYYMLTGTVPPDAFSLRESSLYFPPELRISDNFKWVVSRCLQFESKDRFQSAVEIADTLERMGGGAQPQPKPQPPQPTPSNKKTRSSGNGLIYALASVAVILICFISFMFINKPETKSIVESTAGTVTEQGPNPIQLSQHIIDEREINNIISRYSSYTDFGIYVHNINKNYTYGYNQDKVFPASAMCQVVILDALSDTIEQNQIDPDYSHVYFDYMHNGKEAPDSKSEDQTYVSLRKCIEDVAIYGDNNKSNLLVDYIGEVNDNYNGFNIVNRYTKASGYPYTNISRKIYVNSDYIDYSAPANVTTAKEITQMFDSLINKSSIGDSQYMKSIFRAVSNEGKEIGLNKFIPYGYNVCCVNGLNDQSTNNVAIIEKGGVTIGIAILSETDENMTDVEDNTIREKVIADLMAYIIDKQF